MTDRTEKRARALRGPVQLEEELARQELARAQGRLDAVEADIARVERAQTMHDQFARQALLGGGDAAGLAFYRRCVTELGAELARLVGRRGGLQDEFEARRQQVVRWMKQREAFDKLIGRLTTERQQARSRMEQKDADGAHQADQAWRSDAAASDPSMTANDGTQSGETL